MSLDHLKKQAKNLKKDLPAFLQIYPNGKAPLTAFQNLIAGASGYPSWQAAVLAREVDQSSVISAAAPFALGIGVRMDKDLLPGESKELNCAVFYPLDRDLTARVEDRLCEFLEVSGKEEDFQDGEPPEDYCLEMAILCRELIATDPSFIDGYAHLCNAHFHLGEFEESVKIGRPIFNKLRALLPRQFKGRVVYHEHTNRAVFRLAHSLTYAYANRGTDEGVAEARELAKTMLDWWPNDNLGFRFLERDLAAD